MAQANIIEECVWIPSGNLALEGVLAYPEEREPVCALLLLAPHPHMGGNLDNNVIRYLARRAAEDGAVSLRFNYRGVGHSSIELPEALSCYDYFADMEARQAYEPLMQDAAAALDWLQNNTAPIPSGPIIGYSLGAVLAAMIAPKQLQCALIGISPPNRRVSMTCFESYPCLRRIFIGGGNDFAFDKEAFELELRRFAGKNEFLFFPECDHFFRGQEEALYMRVCPYLFSATEGES